ncbi:hypothetical protein [Nocardia sp. XZ_19_385]|uniref:hypothetical protein n=1 Tax=Nocardia sp. XZ_19_385 TaxID=2769488 RepID=UPI00188EBD33|nr:hypothetical protein [Nocardia sp. XZ_19_385]
MTRDLPFDGTEDTEVDAAGSDTAYRVATGVARVARAGAYVTGGALIASNGGGTPARPGDARLDSLNTGWAHGGDADPDSDVPSPTVTFPDPGPNWVPPAPLHSQQTPPPPPAPLEHAPAVPDWMEPDSRASWNPSDDQGPSWYGPETPDDSSTPSWMDTSTPSRQNESGSMDWLDNPGNGLPGHSPFSLPGTQAFSGSNPFLPKFPTSGAAEDVAVETPGGSAGDRFDPELADQFDPAALLGSGAWDSPFDSGSVFDGVGNGSEFGVFFGVDASAELHTEFTVDFGINEQDGLYLFTQAKVEAAAQLSVKTAAGTNVGDQLDQLSDWIDSKPSAGTGSARTTNDQAGSANSGIGTGTGNTHSSAAAPAAAQPAAPALAAPAPAPVAPAPVAPAAPAPVAPAAAPAPVAHAPVAPVAVAPAVAAPVMVQPVAATPLQTTIQPEAASTPIANVLTGPIGASPLTAPAAVAPALFDPPKPAPATKIDPRNTDIGHTGTSPITNVPTTVTNSVPVPSTGATIDPTTVRTPDLGGITKTPGATVTVPTIDIDGTPTRIPGATVTPTAPATKPAPTIDPDGTRPSVPTTQQPTQPKPVDPTHTRPTVDVPSTVDIPTVSVPTQQPTMTHSMTVPTVDIDPPSVHVPTQAPIKPPLTANPKPISDNVDYQAAQYTSHNDHLFASGLSGGLLPHQDSMLSHHDGTDITLV